MKKNKEHWIKSPWSIGIGTTLLSLLVTIGYDYSKEKPILTTIWNILNWITNLVWSILNFDLKVWWIILSFIGIFIFIMLYRLIFKSKSKKEKLMEKAIKQILHESEFNIIVTKDKFLFKFDPKVIKEKYHFDNIRPYCLNCSKIPIRMTKWGCLDYKCNCGKIVDSNLISDVESRIISELEQIEISLKK